MLPLGCKNIKEFVIKWNNFCPVDLWYRKKYNIPFNSLTHRQISMIDIYIEYVEFFEYEYKNSKNKNIDDKYIKGKGNFMKSYSMSKHDIDEIFDEFDIDNIK